MTTIKQQSSHALAAKCIRQELKQSYPGVKFSVRSESYSGGDSVDIKWFDGPTYESVNRIVGKYKYGQFDGMRDLYEVTNKRKDIPQVQYVFIERDLTESLIEKAFIDLQGTYKEFQVLSSITENSIELLNKFRSWTAYQYIHRLLKDKDLTNGFEKITNLI